MELKLEHFIHDLVSLIKEDYNESLERQAYAKAENEKAFADGQYLAYFHVLGMIESQLVAFGAREDLYKGIAPVHGERAEFKQAKF